MSTSVNFTGNDFKLFIVLALATGVGIVLGRIL